VQVVEEAGEAELAVEPPPVELGEGEEDVGEGGALPAEELGDAEGPCSVLGLG
jgi:hypothetical protein